MNNMVINDFFKYFNSYPSSNEEYEDNVDMYESLSDVLNEAYEQAARGKGKERHAENDVYEEQPIMWIEKYFKSYQLGQAVKKVHESQRLPKEQAINELLGAINYLAARVIFLKMDENETD
jgi:hypothetical protein